MKLRHFIIFSLSAILICFAIYIKSISDQSYKNVTDDPQNDTNFVAPDYIKLFKSTAKPVFINSAKSKYRNPISDFKYGDSLFVEVYKLDSLSKIHFSSDFLFTTADIDVSYNTHYRMRLVELPVDIQYKEGVPDRIAMLNFNLWGLNTQNLIRNDSVAYFYSNFKNFSLKFGSDLPQDIFAKCIDDKAEPIEVLFLKKRKALYFILLSPKTGGKIKPGRLLKLIDVF